MSMFPYIWQNTPLMGIAVSVQPVSAWCFYVCTMKRYTELCDHLRSTALIVVILGVVLIAVTKNLLIFD